MNQPCVEPAGVTTATCEGRERNATAAQQPLLNILYYQNVLTCPGSFLDRMRQDTLNLSSYYMLTVGQRLQVQ